MHYYRYGASVSEEPDAPDIAAASGVPVKPSNSNKGKAIDTNPVLSMLLEPRSLVITTSSLYSDHLHGIDPSTEDSLIPPPSPATDCKDSELTASARAGQWVANSEQIRDVKLASIAKGGGLLERSTRISLTCRDVENVIHVGSIRR